MDYKKTGYYFLLVILIIGQLFGSTLTQYIIYDIYFNQIYWHEAYQILLLPMVFYAVLSFVFALLLDLILNQKVIHTKFVLVGAVFPVTLIYQADNVAYSVIASLIAIISLVYWYFFTFYWKKKKSNETVI
jgi:hypothetical protein